MAIRQDYKPPFTMIPRENYWLYLDEYKNLWKIIPTHQPDIPLTIILLQRNYEE